MREHPLFPAKSENEEPPEVFWINVTRREGTENVLAPRAFKAEELIDEEQLVERFGGGTYELIAKNEARSRITARRAYKIAGPPKPLFDAPPAAEPVAAVMPTAAANANGGWREWLPLFMPLVLKYLDGQQSMQAQMVASSNQLMTAVMTQSQAGAREHVQSMSAMHNANMQQLAQILAAKGSGGGGDGKGFLEGVGWMQDFLSGQLERAQQSGDDGETKTLEQLLETFKLYMEMKKGEAQQAVPNGGAAAE